MISPEAADLVRNPLVRSLIDLALLEDCPHGDVTSLLVVPPNAVAKAQLATRQSAVVAGLDVAAEVFHLVDPDVRFEPLVSDSDRVGPGDVLAAVSGNASRMFRSERTALNFLQRMCGIATLTARYVAELEGLPTRLADTRKTIPGWRLLCKYAVRMGGGHPHRFSLSDGVLIKDNHIAVTTGVTEAVLMARADAPHTARVEVEVDTLSQLDEALGAGADAILLDNMGVDDLREAVRRTDGRAVLEASGRVRLENLRAIAETGVDVVSTGATVSEACPVDIGLDIQARASEL